MFHGSNVATPFLFGSELNEIISLTLSFESLETTYALEIIIKKRIQLEKGLIFHFNWKQMWTVWIPLENTFILRLLHIIHNCFLHTPDEKIGSIKSSGTHFEIFHLKKKKSQAFLDLTCVGIYEINRVYLVSRDISAAGKWFMDKVAFNVSLNTVAWNL